MRLPPMQLGFANDIFAIVILIMSVVLHEIAHGYAANTLGDPTAKLAGRLTLNPLKHIDPVGSVLIPAFLILSQSNILFGWARPVPYNPYNLKNQRFGEAIVAAAGPLTNLALAVIFALVARVTSGQGFQLFANLAALITFTNLFLGLFNLIPVPPMDGYTVIRGLLPYRFSTVLRTFEERMRGGGVLSLLAILFVFTFFFAGPFYLLVQYLFGLLVG